MRPATTATEIDKFRFFKIWIDGDDQNDDVKWARKIASGKFELLDFRIEELLGEVKKSKLFNDADIDDAVMKVSRYMEKQLDIYRGWSLEMQQLYQLPAV